MKLKTVQTDNGKVVSVEGKLKMLSEGSNKWQQRVEVWLLNDKVNRNNWQYLNLEGHKDLFANTPILVAYVGNQIGDGHNMKMSRDGKGNEVPDFRDATAERIVGVFMDANDISIREKNGTKWVVGIGTIYTWYAYQLVDKLKQQGSLSISIETLIDQMHKEGDTEVFTKYQILGTTILNEKVAPAVANANIRALSALGTNAVKEITNIRVASAIAEMTKNPQQEIKENKMSERFTEEQLTNLFEGYTVLSAKENTVLLKANGKVFSYTFGETDEVIADEIKPVALNAYCEIGDERIDVAFDSVTEDIDAITTALNNANAEIEKLNATVAEYVKAESERRKQAVVNAARRELAEFNANRPEEERVSDEACAEVITSAESGDFNEVCNENGEWIGESKAADAVAAICARKQKEFDKANALKAKNLSAKKWAFETDNGGQTHLAQNDIEKLISDLK